MAIKPDYHATASDSCYLYPDQLHKSLVMPGNILLNSFDLNNLEGIQLDPPLALCIVNMIHNFRHDSFTYCHLF